MVLALGAACVACVACASPGARFRDAGLRAAKAGDRAEAVRLLRRAVAADPADADARVALGRLERDAGRPGAALRQLDAAVALGEGGAPRRELAALLAERGLARAARAERERWRDLERAAALDPALGKTLVAERRAALTDAGLARWCAGDGKGAEALWKRAPGGEPLAVIAAVDDPERAPLELVGAAGLRAFRVGGGGAWPLLDAYARRGGRDRAVLVAWATAQRWRDASAAPAAGDDASLGEILAYRGSRRLGCDAVADGLALAARAWLRGERDALVDEPLAALVDEHVGDARACPAWARPTILRLGGRAREAADARAAGPGEVPARAAPLVVLEGLSPGAAARDAEDDLELALARRELARRAGRALEPTLAELAARPGAAAVLAARLDLLGLSWGADARYARWRAALAGVPGAPDGDVVAAAWAREFDGGAQGGGRGAAPPAEVLALGLPGPDAFAPGAGCPSGADEDAALARVVEATRRAPAEGDAAARDFVDGAAAPACRAGRVLELHLRLGDTARALSWADEILALEPGDARALAGAVRAAAVAGDAPRARLYLEQAEYWARRRGVPSVVAAGVLVDARLPIEGIAAGRQALALGAGAVRVEALEVLVLAAAAAGREGDAQVAVGTLVREAGAAGADGARRRVLRRLRAHGITAPAGLVVARPGPREQALAEGGRRLAAWLEAAPDDAEAQVAAESPALARAFAHAPWSITLRRAAAMAAPDAAGRWRWLAELLLLGLVHDGARGRAALTAAADVALALGATDLAAACTAERRWK
jgi:tetratricopeptide (TPR) repeat protein